MVDGGRRAPDWAWEEIVLVCDLVVQNQWQQVTVNSPEAIELSELLQTMDIYPAEVRGDKFRNQGEYPHHLRRLTPLDKYLAMHGGAGQTNYSTKPES